MSAFYRKIAEKISVPYKRLSIVRNPDGFLSEPSVQRALTAETGILFVTGSPFELRLHFELSFKEAPDTRFCYICENPSLLLPDIRREAWSGTFSVADLFPNAFYLEIQRLPEHDRNAFSESLNQRFDALRQHIVLPAGADTSAGVVVADGKDGCVIQYGLTHDDANIYARLCDSSDTDSLCLQEFVVLIHQ